MTTKADFNAEEWSTVLEGPPIAGMIVITAQRGGTIRESISMGKVYGEARQQQGSSELLDAIVSEQPQLDPKRYRTPEDLRRDGIARLREAVELLQQKATPEEVDDYKRFVVGLAERAAAAHKEGGFLGVGGQEVSDAERAALDELAAAIDSPDQQHASAG
jgi:hypothetical protein